MSAFGVINVRKSIKKGVVSASNEEEVNERRDKDKLEVYFQLGLNDNKAVIIDLSVFSS